MKPKPSGIEPIALRRATLADGDKVRYRVYSSPTESIVVIAESALMALKISGIEKPYKIVRDLSAVGATIEAQKMSPAHASDSRVPIATERQEKEKQLMTELAAPKSQQSMDTENFKPMNIADLQHNGLPRARILPPDLLSEIIEQHTKAAPAAAEPQAPVEPPVAETPQPAAQPMAEPEPVPEVEPIAPALSTEETLLQMADAVLPDAPTPLPETPVVLSTDDVEKLLNE
jgi:hypothetical protein